MFVFYDWPFPQMCTLQRMQPILHSLLILGSVISDCVVFYGDSLIKKAQCCVNQQRRHSKDWQKSITLIKQAVDKQYTFCIVRQSRWICVYIAYKYQPSLIDPRD